MLHSKTVRWSAAATIAAAVILVIGFWPGKEGRGPGNAFAAAIEQFQKAKTIVCRISTSVSGGAIASQQTGKLRLSPEYGSRCEISMGGTTPMLIQYARVDGLLTTVTPLTRSYTVIDRQAAGNPGHDPCTADSPDAFIHMLSRLKGQATRELGQMNVDGVDSLGYEISGQLLGLGAAESVRSELWVNAKTFLPVRYIAEMPMPETAAGKGGTLKMVYDQFEWDAPLDPTLFTPEIPADYTRIDAKAPAPNEAVLIKGLGHFAEIAGHYPPTLNAAAVTTELAAAMGARTGAAMARGEKRPNQKELTEKALEVGAGLSYYLLLGREGRSPEYFGKTVTPGQADAVLLRWKQADGTWRIIYGDLRTETVQEK